MKQKIKAILIKIHLYKIAKMFLNVFSDIKQKYINNIETNKIYKEYQFKIEEIKERLKRDPHSKINVAFLVVFDSVFPAKNVLIKMLKKKIFNPYIIVIPDISRGNENMLYQMEKTYISLIREFGNIVFKSYKNKSFVDYSETMDIVISANPYDNMTKDIYGINYLSYKRVLPIFINYSMLSTKINYRASISNTPIMKKGWILFAETKDGYIQCKKANKSGRAKIILSGYPKFDGYKQNLIINKNKTVLICSHHTIFESTNSLSISTFLNRYQFLLKLPYLYPNINFIYRPHPLLYVTLSRDDVWGRERTNYYFNELKKNKNVIVDEKGDYLETFSKSDALIDDCGSFLVEYFYTNKPQCYMIKKVSDLNKIYTKFQIKCINNCYKAVSDVDITNFLDKIVLEGQDDMRNKRIKFSSKYITINKGEVSQKIVDFVCSMFI